MQVISAVVAGCVVMLAGAAFGAPVDGKTARSMLFPATGAEVEMIAQDFLPEDQAVMLASVGAQQPYYGAIAVSPDEGIMVEATVAAANYHDVTAASAVALADCNAKRLGARPCVIVALIRPVGWGDRPLKLSAAASEGFANDYKGRGAMALAISASTGLWGFAKGKGAVDASVAACAGGQAEDCAVVIAD